MDTGSDYVEIDMKIMITKLALWWMRRQFRKDPDYAWGWHCNIAMSAVDAGCPRGPANRGARNFMLLAFDIDTSRLMDAGTEAARGKAV